MALRWNRVLSKLSYSIVLGGDLGSTRIAKPKVHAEVQCPRKSCCKSTVANDDNYALAA